MKLKTQFQKICVGEEGQSTVEFAIVSAAFITVVVALGLLHSVFSDGLVLEHVLAAASHHVSGTPAAFVADIFRY